MLLVKRNKNIYGLGVGISTVFKKYGHFLFKGVEWDHHRSHDLHTIRSYLTQEYIYGVGISTVFEIVYYFLYQGRQGHSVWS
jgi:hypothetical protein